MKGNIFDIRRFSTHDGSGLRTTVFLKGCPLQCLWCHNPEGISARSRPIIMHSRCIMCKTCLSKAQCGGVYESNGQISLDPTAQEDWDGIIYGCPTGAIRMDSYQLEPAELLDKLKQDSVFYKNGGGVTFSGGEPLMQGDFLIEMLKLLKAEGINTAIETSLYGNTDILVEACKSLDTIYADFKVFDRDTHKKYTGVFNDLIKKHIELLLKSEHRDKVIIRTPLIPDHTAAKNNLADIARFISDLYPDVKYELLNYNPLAGSKYHLIGKEYSLSRDYKLYTASQMDSFKAVLKENGVRNVIDDA